MREKLLFLCCLLLIFISCKRATKTTSWDTDLVAPLVKTSLNLGNIFPDTIIHSNNDSSLKIAFETEIFEANTAQYLKVPDTMISNMYSFPIPGGYIEIDPGQIIFPASPVDLNFSIDAVELKKIIIRSGKLELKAENGTRQPLVYNYTILSAKKNGNILNINLPVNKATFLTNGTIVPGTKDTIIDLSQYEFDLTGKSGNTINSLSYSLQYSIANSAQHDSIKFGHFVKSTISFKSIVPEYTEGYFGQQSMLIGPARVGFDLFKKIKSGYLNMSAAKMLVKVRNELGMEMSTNIHNLYSYNSNTNTQIDLKAIPFNNAININAAVKSGNASAPYIASTKTININNTNSQIVPFINNLPDSIGYLLTVKTNPWGNLSGSNDFAYFGAGLKVYLNLDVPLTFSASDLTLRDTAKFDLNDNKQLDHVNYGNLILLASNSFPLAVNMQGYLLNEQGVIIDSLFNASISNNLISAADLNAGNKVVAPKKSELRIPLTKKKIENLKQTKKIYFISRFNTSNQPILVKFYNYYALDLILTMDINYEVDN